MGDHSTPKALSAEAEDGRRLNLADWGGEGTPVLLVHGLAAHLHWWDDCAPLMAAGLRVVALDLRGHGDSGWAGPGRYGFADYAQDIEDARRALGWERFTLVGHSLGARAALVYAARNRERLLKVAALDFLADVPEGERRGFEAQRERPRPVYTSREAMIERFRLHPPGTAAPPERVARLAALGSREFEPGRWSWKFDWRVFGLDFRPVWDVLPEVRVPCLLMRGEHSAVMTKGAYERVLKELPYARGAVVPETHHHLPIDAPEETARALMDFAI